MIQQITFIASEIEPNSSSANRVGELKNLLKTARKSQRTLISLEGDADRASCPVELSSGGEVVVIVIGNADLQAVELLRKYIIEADI